MVKLRDAVESALAFLLKLSLRSVALIIIILVLLIALGNYLNLNGELKEADAIVVLSGGDTKARTQAGIELYKAGWANLLILSGAAADPSSKSNAEVMREQAINQGVPPAAILIDTESENTSENARQINKTITKLKISRIILVSSGYHIRRAKAELQDQNPNLDIITRTSHDRNWSPNTWWLTPYGWWVTAAETSKLIIVSIR